MVKFISILSLMLIAPSAQAASQTFWLHTDALGSIRSVTDSTGKEVQNQAFHSYGEKASQSTNHKESLGFTGERTDESGLIYLRGRFMDPVAGRFISPDPIVRMGSVMGMNAYAYADQDPVNLKDPSGMSPCKYDFCSGVEETIRWGSASDDAEMYPGYYDGWGVLHNHPNAPSSIVEQDYTYADWSYPSAGGDQASESGSDPDPVPDSGGNTPAPSSGGCSDVNPAACSSDNPMVRAAERIEEQQKITEGMILGLGVGAAITKFLGGVIGGMNRIAQAQEARYMNHFAGTCTGAAMDNCISGIRAGYNARIITMEANIGKHAVTELSRYGQTGYLSWGRVFNSLDEVARYGGMRSYTIRDGLELFQWVEQRILLGKGIAGPIK
jgi:RHS repeat-associated protein